METSAVLLKGPQNLSVETLALSTPGPTDLVVDVLHSGISTGTEKLFWTGEMPPFPGMGYPLVPGYEAVGEVVEAGALTDFKPGETVFVPGANCFESAFGLFGGAASRVVTDSARVVRVDADLGARGALLALAATAKHAMSGPGKVIPDLIVGHGTLGRLLARLSVAAGGNPTVWEIDPKRHSGARGYDVLLPDEDRCTSYKSIYDASGQGALLNDLVGRLAKGGEIVLAGFYREPLSFAFPPAFAKEARFRVAAEWERSDLAETTAMVRSGALSLDDLITHTLPATDAPQAYEQAFTDSACLKMILDWEH